MIQALDGEVHSERSLKIEDEIVKGHIQVAERM
jgi:hypothetical protein